MSQHPHRTCISRSQSTRSWTKPNLEGARYWDIKRMRIVLSSGPFAGGACKSMSEDMRLVKHSFGDGPLVDSQTSPLQREPFNHIKESRRRVAEIK